MTTPTQRSNKSTRYQPYPTPDKDGEPKSSSQSSFVIPPPGSKNPTPWKENPAIPPDTVVPRIQSVVSTVRLGCPLDLEKIVDTITDLIYNKGSLVPLKLLLNDPYAVGMVFPSGKMVVTGTTSVAKNREACLKLYVRIKYCGFPLRRPVIEIQNITATVDLKFKVKLAELSKCECLKGMIHQTENFSGLTVNMMEPKATVVIFRTGRVVITGVTTESQVKEALLFIYPFAKLFAS